MRYPVILFFLTFTLITQVVSAQYYDTGQDPASLKWMQIKTDRFTIIYPEKYGEGGLTYARSLDEAYSKLVSLFPKMKFKIPVIIHNYATQSNGYVAWAPRRMELYPTPEQNTIPIAAEKQLAIHELTHVFQMESLNKSFTKVMSVFLGEQFTGIVSSLLPLWFLEGDAVLAESVLTESGRGMSPSFQKQLKAMAVEKGRLYNYDKIINGSYRDFVPDHYQSGYQMVTWAMIKYDQKIWNRVLKFTSEQPFTINPVNLSLSGNYGLTKKKLFKETFDTLGTIWTDDVSKNNAMSYKTLNPSKKGKYINYYSPVIAGTDSIIAIKTSLLSPPAFVLISTTEKTERIIHLPGQMYPWYISYANGKLVWVETKSDPRWANRDYSVIKLMDLRSKQTIRLSKKSRFLSASVSPDGHKIAAVENTINNKNNIVLIDAQSGTLLLSSAAPGNAYLQRPQWTEGGEKITVISLTEEGEGILSFNFKTREWKTLVDAGRRDLQSSFLRNDSLFFISSQSGTDNIYLLTPGGKTTSLTRSRFGIIDLCINGEKIIFSDYSSSGNSICSTILTGDSGNINDNISSSSFLINRFDSRQQSFEKPDSSVYTPEPYRKWQHLFRLHSWMPFYADIEEIKADPASVRPGISIMTQNQLSTLISSIGYEYSLEKNHVLHSRITWMGRYPVIESQLDYGDDPRIYQIGKDGKPVNNPSEIQSGIIFTNRVSVPLHFSSGRFTEFLQPSLTSEYRNDYIFLSDVNSYDNNQTILSGRLYFSRYHTSAIRDIYPKWAQTFDLNYSYAPFDRKIYGNAATLKTSFYFPGIFPNNGIKIRFEIEKQNPSKFIFGNRVSFPRGYKNISSTEFELLSLDYVFPLAYPDFNISSLLYIKRIRTGLFYDYVSGPGNSFYKSTVNGLSPVFNHTSNESFKSFGFELMADLHVLRIPFMMSGGIQTAWKKFGEAPSFELLFNIDLFGMTIGRKPI
jgi:hypothetical protein